MGKAKNGILGAVSGKVGNLIFYIAHGEPRVRTRGKRDAALTPAERINTGKMTVLMNFFKGINPFLKLGFGTGLEHSNLNYHNAATSYNKKNAVRWLNGKAEIEFSHIRVSSGTGLEPENAIAQSIDGRLHFDWTWSENISYEAGKDQVMMLAYFPTENFSVYELAGAKRKTGQDFLVIPESFSTKRMEVYISFISQDRKTVSNSIYLGRFN